MCLPRKMKRVLLLPFLGLCLPLPALAAEYQTGAVQLEEIVVTGTRTPHTLADVPVETHVITREDLDRIPSQNIIEALKTIPGINTSMLDEVIGADNLRATMRGLQLNHGYGLVLIDGRRTHGEIGAHGDYGISLNQIPLSMVERIEVVKGGASALYGADALAGVVNIITRRVPGQTSGTVGTTYGRYRMLKKSDSSRVNKPSRDHYRAHASVGGPALENSGYHLLYSHEADEGIGVDPAKTKRHAMQGKWQTKLTDHLSYDLGVNLSQSHRELAQGSEARYDREYDSYRFSGGLSHRDQDRQINLRGYRYWQDFVTGFPGFGHGYRHGEIGYDQAELTYTRYLKRHTITTGLEYLHQRLDYVSENFPDDADPSTLSIDENVRTTSFFIQDEIQLLDYRLTLVPGVRVEDHSTFGAEINPKLSAMYWLASATTLRASAGRSFKSPTIRQLYYSDMYLHGDRYRRSNPDLEPETAWSYSLNVEQGLLDQHLLVSVGLFRTDLKDMVVRQDTGEVHTDGIPIDSYTNVERARVQGTELAANLVLNQAWSAQAGFTWTDSENRDTGNELPFTPQTVFTFSPTYVHQPWDLGVSLQFNQVGRQYRDAANTQEVSSHTVIDARLWHDLNQHLRFSMEGRNLTASARGDDDYAFRMGRSVSASLEMNF